MRRFGFIILVLSLSMTLTQCKKKDFAVSTNSEAVFISLDVTNSSKVNVNTNSGAVKFEKYDVIYAVSDGIFVGTLEHNGERFAGSIAGAVNNEPLFFYFLGNKKTESMKVGETTSCSVIIDDQTEKLPVISFGISNEVFSEGRCNYSAYLTNKCALVKFKVNTTYLEEPICINGLNNKVEIDFASNSFRFSQEDGGIIKLGSGAGEHWAILLPNDMPMEEGGEGTAFSADYRYIGKRPAIDAVYSNDFVTHAYEISVVKSNVSDGKFSLNGSKRVIFAKGNVQYIADGVDTPYWKFADHQYDLLNNTSEQKYDDANINRDRFGWGTGANPNNVSPRNADYATYVDWGANFPNDEGYEWHAPKCIEWEYVMFTRNATKLNDVYNARYARASIAITQYERVNGLILFPDVYNHPEGVKLPVKSSINYTTDNNGGDYSNNIYTTAEWAEMEAAGAVFLPAGGQRIVKGGNLGFYDVNTEGHYWSQCDLGDPDHACNIYYTTYRPYIYDKNDKYKGFSVRLVHE